jgi:DHA3 family macrolide efflux protein-like MFS transporter
MVLATPLVLSLADAATLGMVLSTGGVGMLLGSVLMSVWGGPKRRIHGMYAFMLLDGLAILTAGVWPSTVLFAVAAFGFFFALPLDAGCSQAILHAKLQPRLQGRVFATQHMLAGASLPVGFLLAGPLGDWFEPLLAHGGPLADSVGLVLGEGAGRGIGLLFVILGGLYVLLTALAYLYPRLRLVEIELPDATYATPTPSPSLHFSEALSS